MDVTDFIHVGHQVLRSVVGFFEWLVDGVGSLERGVARFELNPLQPGFLEDLATGSLGRLILLFVFLFIAGFSIVLKMRINEMEEERKERLGKYFIRPTKQQVENTRWKKVEELFHSQNPNDWRVAIIEADAMLEDLTLQLGYNGATLGERLRKIERSDFPTLNHAWEAHKVRNKIAHEGSNFHLTPQHAWHVYKLYETVFRDARFI